MNYGEQRVKVENYGCRMLLRHATTPLVRVSEALMLGAALVLAGGCGDRSWSADSSMTTSSSHGSGTSTGITEDDADDSLESKLDAFMGDDGIDTGDDTCKKVDLLFVVDNSGSMADEQANLVASFSGFITAIQQELAETDGYHVGVITTDAYDFDTHCTPVSLGKLVTRTGGAHSSNAVCTPYSSGASYMTEKDDLAEKFSCATQVGTGGDGNERPMQAMISALSPPLTDDDGCNAGFLRDDALLVVVIITDEEDDHEIEACHLPATPGSEGEPAAWFDAMVDVKGIESNIVVLSLVGPDAEAGSMCPVLDKCNGGADGAEVASRIIEFTRMFTYGFIGPVCQDYGPIFQESIGVIKTACNEFTPAG